MNPQELKEHLRTRAIAEGFNTFGVADATTDLRADYLQAWLKDGQHGTMAWMERPERLAPENLLPQCTRVVVVGLNYFQKAPARTGSIATYALGADYHKLLPKKLKALVDFLQKSGYAARPTTDTAPVMEKPLGAATGIGWQGKNTILVSPEFGQWLFLSTILTDAPLPVDTPQKDRCGTCTRCIDACPTGAITAPYQLDARRCIAYLTNEHAGAIAPELMGQMGDHLFGCEDCLAACPWNRWARQTHEAKLAAREYPGLIEMLAMTPEAFATTFAGTPIKRLGLDRLQRNVCIVLGNTAGAEATEPLQKIVDRDDAPEFLRSTATWAIARIAQRHA